MKQTLEPAELTEIANTMVGNWQKFDSFCWFERPENAEDWTIVYTHNRDSQVLDLCNAEVIKEELSKPEYENDVKFERHTHWAVGWVEGIAIRVFNSDRTITPAFTEYAEC